MSVIYEVEKKREELLEVLNRPTRKTIQKDLLLVHQKRLVAEARRKEEKRVSQEVSQDVKAAISKHKNAEILDEVTMNIVKKILAR